MPNCNCSRINCLTLLLISIILAMIATTLLMIGPLPQLTTLLVFLAALAILTLLFLGGTLVFKSTCFINAASRRCSHLRECINNCLCSFGPCLLVSAIGLLIISAILLSIQGAGGMVIGVLIFLLAVFFFWLVLSFWALLACILNCLCNNDECDECNDD